MRPADAEGIVDKGKEEFRARREGIMKLESREMRMNYKGGKVWEGLFKQKIPGKITNLNAIRWT